MSLAAVDLQNAGSKVIIISVKYGYDSPTAFNRAGTILGLLGVSSCNEASNWRYYIGVESSKTLEGKLEELIVPKATWAIFAGEGINQSIQELEKRIVTEWLPTSRYEYGNAPDMEVYLSTDPDNAKYEVWIPVLKRRTKYGSFSVLR
ncbi:MAG: transcriptional regulator, AraC family [Herbinix sp.]|jgi:AraC family transcriptional regulator|nr:transcriptional regulator, AraC family [Herbinix sp.]